MKAEPVTPLFLKQVAAALASNDAFNTLHRLSEDDPSYRPTTHAELARAIDCDPNTIKHLLGGVRAGTKAKKISRSKYVPAIREALKIQQMESIEIPANRVALFQRISSWPDAALDELARRLDDLERGIVR